MDGGNVYGDAAPVSEVEHRVLPKDTEFSRKNYDDFHDHNIFFSIVTSITVRSSTPPSSAEGLSRGARVGRLSGREIFPLRSILDIN